MQNHLSGLFYVTVAHKSDFSTKSTNICSTYPACKAVWMPVSVQTRDVVVNNGSTTSSTLGSKHLKEVSSEIYVQSKVRKPAQGTYSIRLSVEIIWHLLYSCVNRTIRCGSYKLYQTLWSSAIKITQKYEQTTIKTAYFMFQTCYFNVFVPRY